MKIIKNGKKRPGDLSYNVIFLKVTRFVINLYGCTCVFQLCVVRLNSRLPNRNQHRQHSPHYVIFRPVTYSIRNIPKGFQCHFLGPYLYGEDGFHILVQHVHLGGGEFRQFPGLRDHRSQRLAPVVHLASREIRLVLDG